MQAIATKYLGPTNSRGGRVKATADAGSLTVPWNHAVSLEENHTGAALALAHKLGWTEANGEVQQVTVTSGSLPGGGHAHVLVYAVAVERTGDMERVTYRRYVN